MWYVAPLLLEAEITRNKVFSDEKVLGIVNLYHHAIPGALHQISTWSICWPWAFLMDFEATWSGSQGMFSLLGEQPGTLYEQSAIAGALHPLNLMIELPEEAANRSGRKLHRGRAFDQIDFFAVQYCSRLNSSTMEVPRNPMHSRRKWCRVSQGSTWP